MPDGVGGGEEVVEETLDVECMEDGGSHCYQLLVPLTRLEHLLHKLLIGAYGPDPQTDVPSDMIRITGGSRYNILTVKDADQAAERALLLFCLSSFQRPLEGPGDVHKPSSIVPLIHSILELSTTASWTR